MEINIKFNEKIYPLQAIKLAIKDFEHLAKFNLKKDKNYITLTLSQIQPDVKKTIKDEFSNYVLACINKV